SVVIRKIAVALISPDASRRRGVSSRVTRERCAMSVAAAVALLSWTASLVAAQPSTKRQSIGLLSIGTDPTRPLPPQWLAFFDGLRALGWVDGQNIRVEHRFSAGDAELVSGLAAELVQLGVDVIVATGLRENQAL